MIVLSVELPDVIIGALDTIGGRYGNGPERKQRLKEAGFNADRVQNAVNDLLKLFDKYENEV